MNVNSYLASHKKAAQLIDPVWAILHAKDELSAAQIGQLNSQVNRLEAGEPLAYVLGYRNFFGRDFTVTSDVLIPRPETEQIIDTIKKLKPDSVLDVGTGSGCIAITIKAELPNTKVDAIDISDSALQIAQKNAQKILNPQAGAVEIAEKTEVKPQNQTKPINFQKSDLLANIDGYYDIIIANLPYVDKTWDWLDFKTLNYEPQLALYAKDGGLELIKKLINQIAIKQNCKQLVLEADPCQHDQIINYAKEHHLRLTQKEGFILVFKLTTT